VDVVPFHLRLLGALRPAGSHVRGLRPGLSSHAGRLFSYARWRTPPVGATPWRVGATAAARHDRAGPPGVACAASRGRPTTGE